MRSKYLSRLPNLLGILAFGLVLGVMVLRSVDAATVGDGKPQTEHTPPALFIPVKADAQVQAETTFERDRQVVRSRAVNIDLQLLTGSAKGVADTSVVPAQAIFLNLFDDVSFIADADQVEPTTRGVNWIGRLRGIDQSQVIIVVSGDIVSGSISMPGARYHIRYTGNGVHEVQAIDQSLFPPDEPFVPVPPSDEESGAIQPQSPDVQADSGSAIDVMVVYTAGSRAAAGGTAAIQSMIDLAVAETNQSYLNSGIVQRVRLVHSEEVVYTGLDFTAALNCITSTSDGCLDNIHTLRDAFGADLVSFWFEGDGGSCGLGWQMDTVSSSFAIYGFSVVARSCATGNYSFGHEMGHNMGARHDVYMESNTTPYTYAHGYVNADAGWRTIMAYNNACTAVGKNCTRLQYWSNPTVSFGGAAMGNATADNHQTLNNTAYTVANFRQSTTNTPVAAVLLSGSAFRTGQTITYQATLTPGSTPTQVDIYLGVLLPDGVTFLSFVSGPGGTIASFALGSLPMPFATNVTLTPTVVPFSYTFTGTEPVGTYFTYAGLAVAGSDPLQPANRLALGVQAFQFSP